MPATRATGIQASNIIEGSRKRLRTTNEGQDDTAPAAAATGTIERRIHALNRDQVTQHGFHLLNILMEARDPSDGALLCEPFLKLPSKRQYPDYYKIIKRPMTLEDVRQRLQQGQYATLPEVKHDCETICNNAKRYNVRDSEIWQLAKELHSIVKITYVSIVETLPESGPAAAQTHSAPLPAAVQTVKEEVRSSPRPKRITLRHSRSQQKMPADAPTPAPQPSPSPSPPPPPRHTSAQPPAERQRPAEVKAEVSNVKTAPGNGAVHETTSQGAGTSASASTSFADTGTSAEAGRAAAAGHRADAEAEAEADADVDVDDDDDDDDNDAEDRGAGDSQRSDYARTESPMDPSGTGLTKGGLLDGRRRPGPRGKRLKATLRGMIANLRKVIGKQGHPVTQFFDELPPQEQYPDYYAVVQRPISLAVIERWVHDKDYVNAYALFVDLELMLDNAQNYNQPGSVIWNDAQEIRSYLESVAVPSLIADGFTLEKNDVRQSALPLHLAANSTIEAHKAAYRLLVAKSQGLDPDSDVHEMASASPEPSGAKLRLGTSTPQISATMQSPGPGNSQGLPSTSASPMGPHMSPPRTNHPPPLAMSPQPASQQFRLSPSTSAMPLPPPTGMSVAAPSSPRSTAHPQHPQPMATPDPTMTTSGRSVRSTRSGKPAPLGPVTPITDPKQARRSREDDAPIPLPPQAALNAQQRDAMHVPCSHLGARVPNMAPPIGGGYQGTGRPTSPHKQAQVARVQVPVPFPIASVPFEGERRTSLISNFTVHVHVESEGGRSAVCSPALRLRNQFAKQHSIHLPPSTSFVTVLFPLRVLPRQARERPTALDSNAAATLRPHPSADAGAGVQHDEDGDENEGRSSSSAMWPWRAQLTFNGRQVSGGWSSATVLASASKPGKQSDGTHGSGTGKVGTSLCQARLLPSKGVNVFEITVMAEEACEALRGLPVERYRIYLTR